MNKTLYWDNKEAINSLQASLNNNEISITDTDTILGFLGNTTQESFNNIINIKGAREEKPFIILISDVSKLKYFIDINIFNKNNKIINLLNKFWPGPLTVIFKAHENLPDFLKSKNNTIAIRCPKHSGLQNILKNFNGLFSTSANKTGEQAPTNINNINPEIIKNINYIILDKPDKIIDTKNKLYQTLPSTIIEIANNNNIKIIRQGACSIQELEKCYGEKFVK
jgi:L-threonylcarbamoyladenylate synthase